jgi:signal transduction histidine kinase
VGAYVVAVAAGACILSRASLLAYSALTLGLAGAVAAADPSLRSSIFLPGLATMLLLVNVMARTRPRLDEERAERVRAEIARAAAQQGLLARDEFLSVAAHELYTPLTSLQLTVQSLARKAARDVDGAWPHADLLPAFERCQRQVDRLTRFIGTLLDASRLASGNLALHREPMALVDLVKEVADSLTGDVAATGCELQISGDPSVAGNWDRMRIEQVVTNLLRNALAFGAGKPIRAAVSAASGRARIEVSDEGIGIDPAV